MIFPCQYVSYLLKSILLTSFSTDVQGDYKWWTLL